MAMAGCSLEEVLKRFLELEASQARLRDHLQVILEEEERRQHRAHGHGRGRHGRERGGGDRELAGFPAGRFAHGPYSSVLRHLGHALHVYRPDTGEIIFWNQSAESLYGWKEQEALGKRVGDLLMDEESNPNLGHIMDQYLTRGQPWSGHLALRKRSGEMVLAMVTKSPLYDEEGGFLGVITVSIDAALFLGFSDGDQVHGLQQLPRDRSTVFSRSFSCGDIKPLN
ncbi:hypothetical protein Cni_G08822 [Canna indica]|uniref:PAS domain-containing protein n=1 Tax=Canna indica TaxID=4628 RepID=A0AAQ3K2V2_9LILI|nr:hypothetical protein Cni_G08822 [Canna indica]